MDTNKLSAYIKEKGPEKIAFILLTITNNNIGGVPVSMENIKKVSKIAKENGITLIFDAARFTGNAYFIHEKEKSYKFTNIKGEFRL